ncbi:hypothetical protein BDV59DRAFT_134865 [Aspergillus ambiguus]|uniref:uncharacterized protein n=1 Tax=Aspergillus ambiguus TaxID=176160 RepID=UPI003CCCC254
MENLFRRMWSVDLCSKAYARLPCSGKLGWEPMHRGECMTLRLLLTVHAMLKGWGYCFVCCTSLIASALWESYRGRCRVIWQLRCIGAGWQSYPRHLSTGVRLSRLVMSKATPFYLVRRRSAGR